MSDGAQAVDDYIAATHPEFRAALNVLRIRIAAWLTQRGVAYEERVSYAMPGFQVQPERKMIAGYAAHKHACGFDPHSGSILRQVPELIGIRGHTKSALHFSDADPIPDALLFAVLDLRLTEIRGAAS